MPGLCGACAMPPLPPTGTPPGADAGPPGMALAPAGGAWAGEAWEEGPGHDPGPTTRPLAGTACLLGAAEGGVAPGWGGQGAGRMGKPWEGGAAGWVGAAVPGAALGTESLGGTCWGTGRAVVGVGDGLRPAEGAQPGAAKDAEAVLMPTAAPSAACRGGGGPEVMSKLQHKRMLQGKANTQLGKRPPIGIDPTTQSRLEPCSWLLFKLNCMALEAQP